MDYNFEGEKINLQITKSELENIISWAEMSLEHCEEYDIKITLDEVTLLDTLYKIENKIYERNDNKNE